MILIALIAVVSLSTRFPSRRSFVYSFSAPATCVAATGHSKYGSHDDAAQDMKLGKLGKLLKP